MYKVTDTLLSSPSPLKVELKNDGTRKDKVPEEWFIFRQFLHGNQPAAACKE